jgi:hypothetical protein
LSSFPSTSVNGKPLFADLTHLHIYTLENDRHWPWISILPALTHLCIPKSNPPNNDRPSVETFLKGKKRLRLLVCTTVESIYQNANIVWIDDPRVVLADRYYELDRYVRDWTSGADGGRDFWSRIEEFLAKKQDDESISLCPFFSFGFFAH